MKRTLTIVLGLMLGGAALSTMLPCYKQALAQSGCCKVRQGGGFPWKANGMDFASCKSLNETDQDNVLKKSGKVWWDAAC